MPAKTSAKTPSRPRRSTPTPGAGGRFGRSTPTQSTGGRFGRPSTATPKRGTTSKSKPKGKGKGKKGGLSGLLSSLPLAGLGKKAATKSSSKAKPALALAAAGAGALLGRQRIQKRKEDEVVPVTTVPPTPSTVNDTTPPSGAPRPADTTTDAI